MKSFGRIGREAVRTPDINMVLTGQHLSKSPSTSLCQSPMKRQLVQGSPIPPQTHNRRTKRVSESYATSRCSSICNSQERISPRKTAALFAFAPESLQSAKRKDSCGPVSALEEGRKSCQRCKQASIFCINCDRKMVFYARKESAKQLSPRKSSVSSQHKLGKLLRLKEKKPYFADLDFAAIKSKLAQLNMKWPEDLPSKSTQPQSESADKPDSDSARRLSFGLSPGIISSKRSYQKAGSKAMRISSRRVVGGGKADLRLSPPPRGADYVSSAHKKSLSPDPYCAGSRKSIATIEHRLSGKLKPITASPCNHYLVDMKICHEFTSEEMHRANALRELSDKVYLESKAGSILKHHYDIAVAPWVEESQDSPDGKVRCVRFGDPVCE